MTVPELITNDNSPRLQFVSTVSQTDFVYDFAILTESDPKVFLTPFGQVADPINILTLDVDYTIPEFTDTGGTVRLFISPAAGSILTIERDTPSTQLTNYVTDNFTKEALTANFNKLTLLIQQAEMLIERRGLTYIEPEELDTGQTIIPKLKQGEFWTANSVGKIVAGILTQDPGSSTLRAELLSSTVSAPGSGIVGHNDSVLGATTVDETLIDLRTTNPFLESFTEGNYIIGGIINNVSFQSNITATVGPGTDKKFVGDMWYSIQFGGIHSSTVARSTVDQPTFTEAGYEATQSILLTTTILNASPSAADSNTIEIIVEGFDIRPLMEQPMTVSFLVRSTQTGFYGFSIANVGADRSVVKEFEIDGPSLWKKISFVIPPSPGPAAGTWDLANGIGMIFRFCQLAGSNFVTATTDDWIIGDFLAGPNQTNLFSGSTGKTFQIAALQVIRGAHSSPFDLPFIQRTFGEELDRFSRYYQKSYELNTIPGTAAGNGAVTGVNISNTENLGLQESLHSRLRATPPSSVAPANLIPPYVAWFSSSTGALNNLFNQSQASDNPVVNTNDVGDATTGQPVTPAAVDLNFLKGQFVVDVRLLP